MIIKTQLSSEERLNVLTENREEIINGFICRGRNGLLKEAMVTLLEWVESDNFYSNFLNSFEGVSIEEMIDKVDAHFDEFGISELDVNIQNEQNDRAEEILRRFNQEN